MIGSWRGRRIRKTTHETDFQRAQVELLHIIQERQEEYDQRGKPKKRTVAEAFEGYRKAGKRSEQTIRALAKIEAVVGKSMLCEQINAAVLNEIRHRTLQQGAKDQTFKRQIVTPMKAALSWAASNWGAAEGCTMPVFPRIRNGERRTVILLPHEAEEMVCVATKNGFHSLAAIAQFGFCEAPRRGELYGLDWQFVDVHRRTATFRDVKDIAGVVRDRLISELRPRSVTVLQGLRAETDGTIGPVFRMDDGRSYPSLDRFGVLLNAQLKLVLKEMNFPDPFTIHNLRHTAASWWYAVTPDPERLRMWGDWKSLTMAMRYVHLLPENLAGEVRAFWDPGSN